MPAPTNLFPVDPTGIRTFQKFLWQDMPGARLPDDPATAAPADWYSPAELNVFRLSSKSHWDLQRGETQGSPASPSFLRRATGSERACGRMNRPPAIDRKHPYEPRACRALLLPP